MNKKILIAIGSIITLILIIIVGYFLVNIYRVKHAEIKITLKEDLTTEFLSEVKVSDFIESINGKIINDYKIDTTTVGDKEIKYIYINDDNIKIKRSFSLKVEDNTPPLVWLNNTYYLTKGSEDNLLSKILCGDNYDNEPTCEIIGSYDINTPDTYNLVFKATDNSGNTTEKKFNLKVTEPAPPSTNTNTTPQEPKETPKTLFSDIKKLHKTENTEIGLDVSSWQGDIDFAKLKEAGVEFLMIRVGGTKGIEGEYFLDSKFTQNVEGAKKYNIPFGIYFYSYANSRDAAIKDAKWVLKQIKGLKLDLPVAFDWENWSFYNEFKLSFFGLTNMADTFLNVFKKEGYDGMIYSSKTYLENIWLKTQYPIWLAHYTKQTNYEGEYDMWQLCSNGKVDGINGDVDIDVRYK